MRDTLLTRTLKGKKETSVPFWFMRQAGRYLPEYREVRAKAGNFLDLCYNPQMAAEVTLQPMRRFNMDAAIIFSDILVVPHALGLKLEFIEQEGPLIEQVKNESDIKKLSTEPLLDRLHPVFEAIKLVRKELPGDKALIGFAGSPWTVACYMVSGRNHKEFEAARLMASQSPEIFSKIIELLTQATIIYLEAQVRAGADVIQLFDSWSGLLDEKDFARWVIEPTRKIVTALKAKFPDLPIIGFPRLAGTNIQAYIEQTGVDGVSLDTTVNMENIGGNITIQGNLDPQLLASDAKAAIARAKIIMECCKNRPLIFNLGHGMIPATPVEHVSALSDFIRSYRA